jgi:hypothetical protein
MWGWWTRPCDCKMVNRNWNGVLSVLNFTSVSEWYLFTPRYSWNTAKGGVTSQSINQSINKSSKYVLISHLSLLLCCVLLCYIHPLVMCMQILILNVCIYLCTTVMHWVMRIKNFESLLKITNSIIIKYLYDVKRNLVLLSFSKFLGIRLLISSK